MNVVDGQSAMEVAERQRQDVDWTEEELQDAIDKRKHQIIDQAGWGELYEALERLTDSKMNDLLESLKHGDTAWAGCIVERALQDYAEACAQREVA